MINIVVMGTLLFSFSSVLMGLLMLFSPQARAKNIFNDVFMKQFLFVGVPVFCVSLGAWALAGFTVTFEKEIVSNLLPFAFCVFLSVSLGQVALAILETFLSTPFNMKKNSREYFVWELHGILKKKATVNAGVFCLLAVLCLIIFPFTIN